jgi:flagellar biosynthesis/type III secretory pathway protein FliH
MAPSIQTADHEAELAGLRQALGATLTRLASLRQEIAIELEPRIVELAIAIAKRIVDGAMDPERVVQWVREGIAQLDAQSAITVRVSPHVWESVPRETWDAIGATVSVDPSMARWDCVIENADGRVDGGASSRLRAVAEALGVEDT